MFFGLPFYGRRPPRAVCGSALYNFETIALAFKSPAPPNLATRPQGEFCSIFSFPVTFCRRIAFLCTFFCFGLTARALPHNPSRQGLPPLSHMCWLALSNPKIFALFPSKHPVIAFTVTKPCGSKKHCLSVDCQIISWSFCHGRGTFALSRAVPPSAIFAPSARGGSP